jgi:hypothetical protein
MKNIILLTTLVFITIQAQSQTKKNINKPNKPIVKTAKSFDPFDTFTVTKKIPTPNGVFKLVRFKTPDSEIDVEHIDSAVIDLTNKMLSKRIADGDTLTKADSIEMHDYAVKEIDFIFSLTYTFRQNNKFFFTSNEDTKDKKTNGTYTFNSTTGVITIIDPKRPKGKYILLQYNDELLTITNIPGKDDTKGVEMVFFKSY